MNYKGKILQLTLVLVLIKFSSGYPQRLMRQRQTQELVKEDKQPWWYQPCGPRHDIRHTRTSKDCTDKRKIKRNVLKPLIQQMKHFKGFFKKQIAILDEHLNKDRNCFQLRIEQYKNDWLPQKPLVRQFRNTSEGEILKLFHREIQIFAVVLQKLQQIVVPENVNITERNRLIHGIQIRMKSVMCELETVVNYTCTAVERIPPSYIDAPEIASNWSSNTDLTQMCTQDRGVLTAYDSFIYGWKNVFRSVKKRVDKSASINSSSSED